MFEKVFRRLSRLRAMDNAAKVALITFFSSLYFYSHIGTLYLQERGLNLFQANSITSIIIGTMVFAELPTGVIADKIGRKNSVIIALALQLLGEILYLFSRSYLLFAAIAVIAGVGFAFASGCIEALVYDTLPAEDRDLRMKKAMGLKGAAYQSAFFLAPLAGSLLVPEFILSRFLFTVFLTACSVGVALIIAFTLREPEKEYQHAEERPVEVLREGIGVVRESKRLRWLVLIAIFTSTLSGSLVSLYQPYFAQNEISARLMGASFAGAALLAVLFEKNAYRLEQWLGPRIGFLIATILPGVFYLMLSAARVPVVLIGAFIFTYATTNLKNPLMSAYQNELIASKNRATVLSLFSVAGSAYIAIITLVLGWLADINLSYPFALSGIVILVAALVLRVDTVGVAAEQAQASA